MGYSSTPFNSPGAALGEVLDLASKLGEFPPLSAVKFPIVSNNFASPLRVSTPGLERGPSCDPSGLKDATMEECQSDSNNRIISGLNPIVESSPSITRNPPNISPPVQVEIGTDNLTIDGTKDINVGEGSLNPSCASVLIRGEAKGDSPLCREKASPMEIPQVSIDGKAYSPVCENVLKTAVGFKIKSFDTSSLRGNKHIPFSDEILLNGKAMLSNCLTGFFLKPLLSFLQVKNIAERHWKDKGLIKVQANSFFYLFSFSSTASCNAILETGPWTFAGTPMILKNSHALTSQEAMISKRVPIWVKLHNLPLEFWTEDGLGWAGSLLGKLLFVDQATVKRSRIDFARLCVELCAGDEIINMFTVGAGAATATVFVEYQGLPPQCPKCVSFGHSCVPKGKHVPSDDPVSKAQRNEQNPEEGIHESQGWVQQRHRRQRKQKNPGMSSSYPPSKAAQVTVDCPPGNTVVLKANPLDKGKEISVDEANSMSVKSSVKVSDRTIAKGKAICEDTTAKMTFSSVKDPAKTSVVSGKRSALGFKLKKKSTAPVKVGGKVLSMQKVLKDPFSSRFSFPPVDLGASTSGVKLGKDNSEAEGSEAMKSPNRPKPGGLRVPESQAIDQLSGKRKLVPVGDVPDSEVEPIRVLSTSAIEGISETNIADVEAPRIVDPVAVSEDDAVVSSDADLSSCLPNKANNTDLSCTEVATNKVEELQQNPSCSFIIEELNSPDHLEAGNEAQNESEVDHPSIASEDVNLKVEGNSMVGDPVIVPVTSDEDMDSSVDAKSSFVTPTAVKCPSKRSTRSGNSSTSSRKKTRKKKKN